MRTTMLVSALLVSVVVLAGCGRSASQPRPGPVFASDYDTAYRNAPAISSLRFKPGVKVYRFRQSWELVDYHELPDGMLYLIIEPPIKPPATAGPVPDQLGILAKGTFARIQLPYDPRSISFAGTDSGLPVVRANPPLRHYVLVGSRALPVSNSKKLLASNGTGFRLHDGRTCVQPLHDHSIYEIGNGEQEVISGPAIDSAIGFKFGSVNIDCATFDGDDYLDVAGMFILRVRSGKVDQVAAGRIWASGPHHLLISSTTSSDEWLEATTN